jgi:DNA-directed RNA polymerase specialized sigma24 family protein
MVETKVLVQDPETKPRPFDPGRCTARQYLTGLVRNATKQLHRFRQHVPAWENWLNPDAAAAFAVAQHHTGGEPRRHDWSDPDNARKGLPSSPEEIIDPVDGWDREEEYNQELVEVALAGEPERVRTLVRACYYGNMTSTEAATLVGVRSHTTVLRQLDAFRLRARARLEAYPLPGLTGERW